MHRRNFLLGSYSLACFADTAPPRKDWQRIAPKAGAKQLGSETTDTSGTNSHMATVDIETDLLVAGGGLSGICAAIAAARRGVKVLLVQDRSRLGGNSSSEVKMHVVGASCHKSRLGWRESGILEEIRLQDATYNPHRRFELWDLLLYDKVVSEPNITLLMESTLTGVKMKNGEIAQAIVRCDKSELIYRIKAKLYVDASGDSRLGLEAGAEMRSGREARSEFNERLAPVKADGETLGSSILFTARQYDKPIPFVAPSWARKITKEHLKHRSIKSWEYGYWWIEWGGSKDIIRDNEEIRFELMAITMGIWDYIKNSGNHPTSANWGMEWIGMMPGKRGSRRMVGDVMMTQNDLERGTWEDAVAMGGWPMDDHPPGGFDLSDVPPNTSVKTKEVYNIPYRALYSKNVKNLFMAGRNISASHVAFTSSRVMATCAVIGQAVGTAAAVCLEKSVQPRGLYPKHITHLQQALLRDDQSIRDLRNQDPFDLAPSAKVSASGETEEAPASKILSGFTRNIPGKEVHFWSAKMADEGAWIDLKWDAPKKLRQIQITFDSGFQRELTLTAQDAVNDNIIRAPQPETVKDYEVLVRSKGSSEWVRVAEEKGNFQRLKRHKFDAIEAEAVRIHVKATNGIQFARIFEVRAYA